MMAFSGCRARKLKLEVWRNLDGGGYALYSVEPASQTQVSVGEPPFGLNELWKLRHLLDGVYSDFSGELSQTWGIP